MLCSCSYVLSTLRQCILPLSIGALCTVWHSVESMFNVKRKGHVLFLDSAWRSYKCNVKQYCFQNRFEGILCVKGHVNIFCIKEIHIDLFLRNVIDSIIFWAENQQYTNGKLNMCDFMYNNGELSSGAGVCLSFYELWHKHSAANLTLSLSLSYFTINYSVLQN